MRAFLMIGQSNMAGRGELDPRHPIVNHDVFMWRNGWETAREPVNPDRQDMAFEGPQLSFGDNVQRALGGQVGLIPCAVGGTALNQWMPGEALFERAVADAQAAQRTASLCGVIWHQGENDAEREDWANTYAQRFLSMLDALTHRLNLDKTAVLVGELGDFLQDFNRAPTFDWILTPHYRQVNRQIHTLPTQDTRILCVKTHDLSCKADKVHFSTPALREMGRRYGSAYVAYERRTRPCVI